MWDIGHWSNAQQVLSSSISRGRFCWEKEQIIIYGVIDEKVEDCAKRELQEEMGLIADELEFFMVNSGKEVHYIYPNGDEVSNIEIIYLC